MVELYQCTRCSSPFVAERQEIIARRGGVCLDCAKIDVLKSMGLPPDFLTRFPFA
jgi:DNA-directed RNA polymerase subunit RPC12/RpoP